MVLNPVKCTLYYSEGPVLEPPFSTHIRATSQAVKQVYECLSLSYLPSLMEEGEVTAMSSGFVEAAPSRRD